MVFILIALKMLNFALPKNVAVLPMGTKLMVLLLLLNPVLSQSNEALEMFAAQETNTDSGEMTRDDQPTEFFPVKLDNSSKTWMLPLTFLLDSNNLEEAQKVMTMNPYLNGVCSITKTVTLTNMKLCIIRENWKNLPGTANNRRFLDKDLFSLNSSLGKQFDRDRFLDKNYMPINILSSLNRPLGKKQDHDCFFFERKLRPVPTSCYDGWDQWSVKFSFQKFISEIINDLRFTYDFVLYSKSPIFELENMLWYNILYLKQLLIHVPNPAELIGMVTLHRDYRILIRKLVRRVEIIEAELIRAQPINNNVVLNSFRNDENSNMRNVGSSNSSYQGGDGNSNKLSLPIHYSRT